MASIINTTLPSLGVGYVVKLGYTPLDGVSTHILDLQAGQSIGLHIRPYITQNILVLNSLINGGWGTEERPTGFPFVVGQLISIMVIVGPTEFEIQAIQEGTGKPPWIYKYKHRLPADSLDSILFHGDNVAMKDFYVGKAF
jgi:Galactoside-binding lectin